MTFLRPAATSSTLTAVALFVLFAPAAARCYADPLITRYEDKWITVRSERPLEPRLADTLATLPQLRSEIADTLHVAIPQRHVLLTVFADRSTYAKHATRYMPDGVSRSALFITGIDADRILIASTADAATDIRHEFTHAYLHATFRYLPLWLDEGLAEYFEQPADRRSRGHVHLRQLRPRSFLFWKPNLERLEAITNIVDMAGDEYRESWAWTHFLIHGPDDVRDLFLDYLRALHRGDYSTKLSVELTATLDGPIATALRRHIRQMP